MAKDNASTAPTKAGFIRQFPTDTPADDIVALGAEAGIALTKKMIWTVQSELRHPPKKSAAKQAKKTAKKPTKKTTKNAATNKTAKKAASSKASKSKKKTTAKATQKKTAKKPTASKAAEQRLKALILQVGLARAEAVYDQLREQLDALLD